MAVKRRTSPSPGLLLPGVTYLLREEAGMQTAVHVGEQPLETGHLGNMIGPHQRSYRSIRLGLRSKHNELFCSNKLGDPLSIRVVF